MGSNYTVEEHRDGTMTVRIHADSGDVIERDARMPCDKALTYIERLEGAGLPKRYWSHYLNESQNTFSTSSNLTIPNTTGTLS